MSNLEKWREAWRVEGFRAIWAKAILDSYYDRPLCRVPGMDTGWRLAIRLHSGKTIEEAIAREYLYRWELALRSPVFGVPHPIGM